MRAVLGNFWAVCGLRLPLHAPQGACRENATSIRLKILCKPILRNCRFEDNKNYRCPSARRKDRWWCFGGVGWFLKGRQNQGV
ncbi:MAG: hypothetical protein LBT53_09715 [Puniceicoccales bacterium]|nr:hypothetical protein [Puniceicoccales bacterium]